MTLAPGARLGPYEVQSAIGAGGMGEVYRARDTRLDRTVALKLLPRSFADRVDRRQRFQQEARAISALQHPHICTLFDVGEQDGQAFLVMEHLDGETLDDRLTRGPLPARDVLTYARQVAGALDHAHRARIVHRDLKPSNVMLTPSGAKLLDFGLARGPALMPPATSSTASFTPEKLTADGTLVGTFQYMAPEQLEGKSADERTDIFAFGTLLYEMATGRRAFEGQSQASLIASILTEQPPPVSSTRATRRADGLPDSLDHIVDRCLAKKPDDRWQTARDLKAEIDWVVEGGSRSAVRTPAVRRWSREAIAWTLAAIAGVVAIVALTRSERQPPAALTRVQLALPPGLSIQRTTGDATFLAMSPDGRHVAFITNEQSGRRLWVQSLDAPSARALEGIVEPMSPFWSPDSRFIGYYARPERELRKVDIAGGPPRTIRAANMTGQPVWARDGTILYSESRRGLFRVSAHGGEPVQVTRVDQSAREINHYWPSMLPDGRRFLFMTTRLGTNGERATPIVYLASLDSSERSEVIRVNSRMVYAPSGHVLYVQEGALMAQRFAADEGRLIGEPARIVESLDYSRSTGVSSFSVSDTGVLAYHRRSDAFQLAWLDRNGLELSTIGTPQLLDHVRISRDGSHAAVEVTDPRLGTSDIWIYDLSRALASRLTTDLNGERAPIWSPDGQQIMFVSDRGTGTEASPDFFLKRSDGMGEEEKFFVKAGPQFVEDWSPDGRLVAYRDTREGGDNLWMLPIGSDRKEWRFPGSRFEEWGARFSPDSKWLAFASNESGTNEVYVAPVTGAGARQRVSTAGGGLPAWRGDGKELFYLSADGRSMWSASITLGATLNVGEAKRLFTIERQRAFPTNARSVLYDAAGDGQRFLFIVVQGDQPVPQISLTMNWMALLR
jgi:eukaryotic-like serine/threonine-protein kinase